MFQIVTNGRVPVLHLKGLAQVCLEGGDLVLHLISSVLQGTRGEEGVRPVPLRLDDLDVVQKVLRAASNVALMVRRLARSVGRTLETPMVEPWVDPHPGR